MVLLEVGKRRSGAVDVAGIASTPRARRESHGKIFTLGVLCEESKQLVKVVVDATIRFLAKRWKYWPIEILFHIKKATKFHHFWGVINRDVVDAHVLPHVGEFRSHQMSFRTTGQLDEISFEISFVNHPVVVLIDLLLAAAPLSGQPSMPPTAEHLGRVAHGLSKKCHVHCMHCSHMRTQHGRNHGRQPCFWHRLYGCTCHHW